MSNLVTSRLWQWRAGRPRPAAILSALLVFRGLFSRGFFSRGFFSRGRGGRRLFANELGALFSRRGFRRLRFGGQRIRFNRALCQRFLAESRFGGGFFSALRFRGGYCLAAIQSGKVIIDRNTDFFHRFWANAFNRFQLLRRHIGQRFHRVHARRLQFLDQPLAQSSNNLQRSYGLRDQRRHLLLHFLPFFFFALDVDLPAQQLRRQPHVLPFFPDRKRELRVVHHHFQMLVRRIHNRHAAHFRRLQRLLRERNRILVILDDVDLFPAQLADDRLHPHALHAHAGSDRIDVLVLRHHCDLRALARFPRNRPDHHRAVINFRYFRLEQMLD